MDRLPKWADVALVPLVSLIFAAAVFESFLYLIANGALDWGPVKRVRHSLMVDANRTLATTVKKDPPPPANSGALDKAKAFYSQKKFLEAAAAANTALMAKV